ncbi:MAG TPA: lysophospholipid acyltransferase family protein [Xanthomonadales bacterium]|nr:lysophospholipid acyltransferase family protein [Xanthomonadales bacterium]
MRKILFWPYQIYAWLIFMPLVLVLTFFASTLSVLFAIVVNPNWASRYIASPWARLLALITPVFVTVMGEANARKDQSYVVVANHQSQYDILILYGWLDLDLKWVMKKELRKVPGIGIGCEKVGHIFVDRRNPSSAKQAIADALNRLGNGVGILFFAEGTRSLDGRLLPFKKGAFATAIEQGLPVLPVTINGTHDVLPAKTLRIFPGKVELVIHPEISTVGMGKADLRQLLDETSTVIQAAQPESLR